MEHTLKDMNTQPTNMAVKIIKIIAYYLTLLSFIYFVLVGVPLWDGLFYGGYQYLKSPSVYVPFPIILVLDALFTLIPLLVYSRKIGEVKERQSNTALIIPCHKAEKVLPKTLQSALEIFDAKSVYVIDNGNEEKPSDGTPAICAELGVNYLYVPCGSKIAAIFVGACITKDYEFVVQIDDDIQLDKNMTFPTSEQTHCIAYTISATNFNGDEKLIHKFQDVEYKTVGILKAAESRFGSAQFAHGAISLWRRTTLLEVLDKHPLYPMSEDWFLGYICNCSGYPIDTSDRVFIKTDVPSVFMLKSKDSRSTGYGGVTLYRQRVLRWYRLTFIQVFYTLYALIFNWKLPVKRIIYLKLVWTAGIARLALVMLKYGFLAINMIIAPVFAGFMLIAIYGSVVLVNLVVNYKHLQKEERFPVYMFFILPLYRLYDSTCLMLGIFWNALTFVPFVIASSHTQLKNNELLQNVIKEYMGQHP